MAKQVCLHTHINHVNEITWVTREAANRLFKHGVIVRNQSVLLKDVNDNVEALSSLIETLASMNIQPVCVLHSFIDPIQVRMYYFQHMTDLYSTTSINATWCVASKTCVHP